MRSPRRDYFDLFLISVLLLFLELAAIRWFSAYVVSLAFFTNFVLMAAFVGMSVGCLATSRRPLIATFPPLVHVAVFLALLLYFATAYFWLATVDVQGTGPPEVVYFGTERLGEAAQKPALPLVVILACLFLLIALWFVGFGQIMGTCFERAPNRIAAYTANIVGSLLGILLFAFCSYLSLPPSVWFGAAFVGVLYFLWRAGSLNLANVTLLATTWAVIALVGWRIPGQVFYWSPYYCVRLDEDTLKVSVNGISHQWMVAASESPAAYRYPHAVLKALHGRPAERVLIIGAGTGNDVAVALAEGAGSVHAVEIDPVIARLGKELHPDRPYRDHRVELIIDDGRSFLKRTQQTYDLILYGLVDSLTLQSTYSSIRLENYLFTQEAFQAVRDRLSENGWFVVYNFFREGWIVHRIAGLMRTVFGHEPVVTTFPPKEQLEDHETGRSYVAAIAICRDTRLTEALRNQLIVVPDGPSGASLELRPATLVASRSWELPTDDWPFLYLREPKLPWHNLWNLLATVAIGLGMIVAFSPERRLHLDGQFLFLGAGFMLIETKGVVQLAQVFGSTWLVNTFVFGGVLVMILAANLVVWRFGIRRLGPWYAALLLTIAISWAVPLRALLGLPFVVQALLATVLLFAPILCAGVIFAVCFRETDRPAAAFGANIAGSVLGGAAEYASLVLGYRNLAIMAAIFYVLSMLSGGRGSR